MLALIIILALTFLGVLISAFMAGGSEKRKNSSCWSFCGIVLSAISGFALFSCKGAIKEIRGRDADAGLLCAKVQPQR